MSLISRFVRSTLVPLQARVVPSVSPARVISSLDDPLSIYCVNRPPGSRYPSPSHKGSLPKCSVIRRLRKRLKIGRR